MGPCLGEEITLGDKVGLRRVLKWAQRRACKFGFNVGVTPQGEDLLDL